MDGLMLMASPPRRITALLCCFVVALMATPSMAETDIEIRVQLVRDALPAHCGAAVLAIDRGKVIFREGFGVADIESGDPVTPATNFRIASVSKQFTATAVMLLVDDRRLALDDTLADHFPGFPDYGNRITVRHLLNHTAGLPDYEDSVPDDAELQVHDRDVLKIMLATEAPIFTPGTRYQYSNTGYALLTLIVEQVTGRTYQGFVEERIFKPCGMDTSVVFIDGLNEVPYRAFGHKKQENGWARHDQSPTSAVLGDGGIYSSLDDLARWCRALQAQRLLSKQAYRAVHTPGKIDGETTGYGFGWRIDTYKGQPRLHHTGSTRGFSLCLQRYPERSAAVVVLINNSAGEKMTDVANRIADLLLFNGR